MQGGSDELTMPIRNVEDDIKMSLPQLQSRCSKGLNDDDNKYMKVNNQVATLARATHPWHAHWCAIGAGTSLGTLSRCGTLLAL